MRAEQMLFSQGFGTRHECRGLIVAQRASFEGHVIEHPDDEVQPEGKTFTVDGQPWPYFEKAIVLLNKPAGYECSQKPIHHPSVMVLLPAPLRARGLQPVGRLDADTTGLLLLTDDGVLQHRLTHPKRHVPKRYRATCKHPITDVMIERLLSGVQLNDEDTPVKAQSVERVDERVLALTITSGRYHQVKRMVAAAGNRIEALHREQFGRLVLPGDLAPGQWVWLNDAQGI